jgi:uncharacterized protein (TIGR03643 family)
MIKLEFYEPNMLDKEQENTDVSSESNLKSEKVRLPLKKKSLKPIFDKHDLNEEDYNRIVEMAWQDRTHFDVIEAQYGLSENEIKNLMRKLISAKAYRRWRKRVQGRKTKHKKRCSHKPTRFQGPW